MVDVSELARPFREVPKALGAGEHPNRPGKVLRAVVAAVPARRDDEMESRTERRRRGADYIPVIGKG